MTPEVVETLGPAARTVADAARWLAADASTALLVHRGPDPLWAMVHRRLECIGIRTRATELDDADRRWAPPTPDADVLVYHDPFGPGPTGSDLDSLYRLVSLGVSVVFVDFPHGVSAAAVASRLRRMYLAALSMHGADAGDSAATMRGALEQCTRLRVRSGSSGVLDIHAPFTVRDDLTSARRDAPILQLPYGEVWAAARPEAFNGTVELLANGHDRVLAKVTNGRIGWLSKYGPNIDLPMVELGIGINSAAAWMPPTTLFEKSYGHLHIGFGDSGLIGGDRRDPHHFDLAVPRGSTVEYLTEESSC